MGEESDRRLETACQPYTCLLIDDSTGRQRAASALFMFNAAKNETIGKEPELFFNFRCGMRHTVKKNASDAKIDNPAWTRYQFAT